MTIDWSVATAPVVGCRAMLIAPVLPENVALAIPAVRVTPSPVDDVMPMLFARVSPLSLMTRSAWPAEFTVALPLSVVFPLAFMERRSVPSTIRAKPSGFAACVAIPSRRVVLPPVMVFPPTSHTKSSLLPVVITVPETFGNVIVRSAVGSVIAKVV